MRLSAVSFTLDCPTLRTKLCAASLCPSGKWWCFLYPPSLRTRPGDVPTIRVWFLGELTGEFASIAAKLNWVKSEFNIGYRQREVQISTLQVAQKPVLSSTFLNFSCRKHANPSQNASRRQAPVNFCVVRQDTVTSFAIKVSSNDAEQVAANWSLLANMRTSSAVCLSLKQSRRLF